MTSLFILNTFEFSQNFLTIMQTLFKKKNQECSREIVSSIRQKIFEYNMGSRYIDVYKIHNVSFIF